jgi:hypothetical protein
MLVETHSWKDYATRVRTHYDTVLSSLEIAKEKARTWKKKAKELDLANYSGKKVELEFEHTKKFSMIDFAGYKFTREKSEISGELVTKYFPESPEVWKIPFYEELKSSLTVRAPKIGYYLQPSDVEWILPKLEVHGIKYEKMKNNPGHLEVFRATKTQFAPKSYEGHQTLTLEGEWKNEKVKLPKAMIFVPLHQPKAKLILQLFEPRSQDSFLFWGFFNRAFERKEYMEDYVAEEVATEMLKNPVIKKEFEKKLKSDPAFAKDPDLRFEFFYRKHPSWDDHFNRYPVFRR